MCIKWLVSQSHYSVKWVNIEVFWRKFGLKSASAWSGWATAHYKVNGFKALLYYKLGSRGKIQFYVYGCFAWFDASGLIFRAFTPQESRWSVRDDSVIRKTWKRTLQIFRLQTFQFVSFRFLNNDHLSVSASDFSDSITLHNVENPRVQNPNNLGFEKSDPEKSGDLHYIFMYPQAKDDTCDATLSD